MRRPDRRQCLQLALGAAALLPAGRTAKAQTYPARPVRWIVGFAAGGFNDLIARLIGQALSERIGQPVTIENRTGAAGNIATEAVVNAPADGYTLLLIGSSNTINPTLYEKLNFNFSRDIAPVASLVRVPLVMVVNPSFPARTVPEFIAYAKANPGKINMASGGSGGAPPVTRARLNNFTGHSMQHVPYRGSAPAVSDLLSGQVQVLFDNVPSAIEHIRAGQLRALAVTTVARSDALPGIPSIAEFVPGYEASGIGGMGVPANTPAAIIDKLNQEINAILADPRMRSRLADLGATPLAGSPADFGKLLTEEIEKWRKVIRFASIKSE
jgi:tripartite-type tricarboxylate transporter receptor subunit TctC